MEAFQLSIGNTSHYLDEGFEPQYPFGFGLSYSKFEYTNIRVSQPEYRADEEIIIRAEVRNVGDYDADEVVQLYIRDLVGSRTRPVRELRGFERIHLKKGARKNIVFKINPEILSFHNGNMEKVVEAGEFQAWIGGDSRADLQCEFVIRK